MEVSSKENIVGLTSNRSLIKAGVTQSIKKPASTKKALADVGNILHSAKKSSQEVVKPGFSGQKLESTKNFKIYVEEQDVIFSPAPKKSNPKRIPLSPISGIKVAANLNPNYQYDDDNEDPHQDCPTTPYNDDFDDLLPPSLRLNSDDIDSLAMLKPPEESWAPKWKSDLSTISVESDLDDFNVPFPSPPKFADFDLPFNEFVVPEVNFDDSF
nr:PREDICTED: uncharacterized protein LOC109039617 [Bemisia tabaci]